MDRLGERMNSALELFLNGCRLWAEIQGNQVFLEELGAIKVELERICHQKGHHEETVCLIEKMTHQILADLDRALKEVGAKGLEFEGLRH